MNGLLGKKIGMTQIFRDDGRVIPVTVIESGPCSILQIKTKEKDGYNAIQLGFGEVAETKIKKPLKEKFKKIRVKPTKFIREIEVNDPENYKIGQNLEVTQFSPGDFVDIIATSIGKGFQGGIKRWNWSGGPESHGSMSHRAPGSIGASAFPSRVYKGHHLPGHMGNKKTTIQNLEVVKIDKENCLLAVKGSVPGHKKCYLIIKKTKKKKKAKVVQQPEQKHKPDTKEKATKTKK